MDNKEDQDFLKETYNKYISSDYKLNEGNLNPKQEMDYFSLTEEKVLELIHRRIDRLKKSLPKEETSPKIRRNSMGLGPDHAKKDIPSITPEYKNETPFDGLEPPIEVKDDTDEVIKDVEDLKKIIDNLTSEDTPSVPDCIKQMPGCSNYDYDDFNIKPDRSFKGKKEGESDSERGKQLSPTEDPSKNGANDIFECWKLELSILEILLEILKIVKIIKTIVMFALSLVNPTIEMITLIGQCFMNPAAIGLLVEKTLEMVMAFAVSLLGSFLEFLWSLLDFECVTDATKQVIDAIKALMSGTANAVYEGVDGISFIKDNYNTEAWEKMGEDINNSWKNEWGKLHTINGPQYTTKEWLEKDGLGDMFGKKAFDGFMNGIGIHNGLRWDEYNNLSDMDNYDLSTGVLKGVLPKDLINKYNNILKASKDVVDSCQRIADETSEGNEEIKKNANSIKNVSSIISRLTIK